MSQPEDNQFNTKVLISPEVGTSERLVASEPRSSPRDTSRSAQHDAIASHCYPGIVDLHGNIDEDQCRASFRRRRRSTPLGIKGTVWDWEAAKAPPRRAPSWPRNTSLPRTRSVYVAQTDTLWLFRRSAQCPPVGTPCSRSSIRTRRVCSSGLTNGTASTQQLRTLSLRSR